ncbi:MAG: glycosyltransferase family 2 protein [Bacteroidetes bacterium]|nr:glycosyltransferase family 2 protein [Bacteroidota bacterium]
MQLTVIIVNYNVKFYVEQCLYSVIAACKNIDAEIIVVDNASSDGSVQYLQPGFKEIIFIENKENVGFSKANNQALQIAKGEYILILNPDTLLPATAIENCILFYRNQKEAGAVGVKMIDGDGNFLPESKRSFPSAMASFWKMTGMASLFPSSGFFNQYALGKLDENAIHQVEVLSGAFFFTTKKILQQLKGFDEDFFMYGEDIDLSYRIQKAGYKNYYLGNNPILHFKGESTKKNKVYVKNFYNAMHIFLDKNKKGIARIVLNTSVNIASFFSLIKHKRKTNTATLANHYEQHFILMGDEKSVESASLVIEANAFYAEKILNYEGVLKDPQILKTGEKKINLVFCIGVLRYKECIELMQQYGGKFHYYWHHCHTSSILGSNKIISTSKEIYI